MPSSTFQNLYEEIHKYQIEKDILQSQLTNLKQKKIIAQNKQESISQAQVFLQTVAAKTQATVEEKLSKLVTSALHTVFPENPYNFIIRFEKKRNTTECQLLFGKNGLEFNPLEESGGGPIDVASIALLISFIMIEKKSPILFLDEPMKNLSRSKLVPITKFLQSICKQLNIQIILVTHIKELIDYADSSFEIINGEINEE